MDEIHKTRLLNVAKALRESPEPAYFTMSFYGHSCNTPACALGHYAARGDLQDTFILDSDGDVALMESGVMVGFSGLPTRDHFDISRGEAYELFDVAGCGGAKTADQAAEYIERFVERKENEPYGTPRDRA